MYKTHKSVLAVLLAILSFALNSRATGENQSNSASPEAIELAKGSIIIDGHIDLPYRLEDSWVDVTNATEDGDFDYPRAKAGGLNAPFMSIYIPAKLDDSAESTARAH